MPAMPKPQDADVEAGAPAAGKAVADQAAEEAAKPAARKVAEEEDPRLRWAFVRKVYAILALQFALTAAVSVAACLVRAVPRFFATGPAAAVWPVFIGILVSPLIGARPLPSPPVPRVSGSVAPACLVWFGCGAEIGAGGAG